MSLVEQRRARFEEKAFAQRFLSSVTRVNDGQSGLQPVGCPTRAEFVAKDADGNYLDNSLNFAWWGYNAALDSLEIELPKIDISLSAGHSDAWCEGVLHAGRAYRDALVAHGLKVKP